MIGLQDIDALIHKYVFGRDDTDVPMYSRDIQPAWQVVEKLAERHVISVACVINRQWRCEIVQAHSMPQQPSTVFADTAPLDICLAALKAVGVEAGE